MHAVEFQTTIKDGTIEIPREFLCGLGKHVRVILLTEDRDKTSDNLIDRLLAQPLRVPRFLPMTREETHAR